ncbi:MAG: methyltransferase domain-containing protein [Candidatus Hydrogenedentes bacterium]|nr:methyltransferase domain-containing protein [Candidatus Hydrogenedentota bacterium]
MLSGEHIPQDWYAQSFGALYPVIYSHRTVEAAAPEAEFAAARLNLNGQETALDLACGTGRHLVHLVKLSKHAVGLDYSTDLLALARRGLGPAAALVQGDMRDLPFQNSFDAVLCFFTSFGYFLDEAENQQTARCIARALKPGGRFFIDHMNAGYVSAHLEPETRRSAEDLTILEERWIDKVSRRINKRTRVLQDDAQRAEFHESVRLYEREELEAALAAAGLRVVCVDGNYDGAAYGPSEPRMLVFGEKA